ncbi:hypothetical protein HYG86_02860 [Alkalicella caledoniensis]|uniref:Peptidase C-terminal archaeal/bacterial domain-containing protein n=1 Tax=Alkalicella caledoniensis TaxID=2731377 RepID=A0A7G9W512_ALKCA|nr:hypothetical protein [Alkalicella caledoniensis]QNO13774.1 hypothetical protein HYG86_02860 [Alkalicella caledoniensis]
MKKISCFILLTLLLLLPNTIYAHQGIFINGTNNSIDESHEIEDIEESKAIYSRILEEGQIDYYTFTAQEGQVFYSQIMVPNTERDRDFMLMKLVFGPFDDLIPNEYLDLVAPFEHGYAVEPGNNRTRFFEPFTQTSYIKKQQISLEIPEDGQYFIAVYNPFGQTGSYVLTVGKEESFGVQELLQYPATWFRVNYWFNPLRPFSILFIILVLLYLLFRILRSRRKKKRF